MTITKASIDDGSGLANLIWFGQGYMKKVLAKLTGKEIIAYGQVKFSRYGAEISNVEWEELKPDGDSISMGRWVPIYPLTEGIGQSRLRRIIFNVMESYTSLVPEILPVEMLDSRDLMDAATAIRNIHFPESGESLDAARRRLVFDELFLLQVGLGVRKVNLSKEGQGISFKISDGYRDDLKRVLPFELTNAQKKVISEIEGDMSRPTPMNRLLQGDVGSGKTVVALAAILIAVRNGFQAALMAPTEILAEQHYLGLTHMLDDLFIRSDVLKGSQTATEKKAAHARISSGETQVVIGTHALIQEGVEFDNLGLVIIDEQHRFGVLQRAALMQKGKRPDILVMTATPIPRTLALTVYGDLDISVIDELPPGRKPIRTHWKLPQERHKVYEAVRQLVDKGRQAYIVCPLIEESDKLQAQAATELYDYLRTAVFSDLKVGLLHGQMRTQEKDDVMAAFRKGEINILVSTTVIEVGVDVPNAVVMIIEDSDRFGLAQLHQLRGRVGRAEHQSFCILIGDASTDEAKRRLQVMSETNDGFLIAEEDLKLRGPGEFFGTKQSGLPALRIADIFRDIPILQEAREEAFRLVHTDPRLSKPEHDLLRRELLRRFEGFELIGVS